MIEIIYRCTFCCNQGKIASSEMRDELTWYEKKPFCFYVQKFSLKKTMFNKLCI